MLSQKAADTILRRVQQKAESTSVNIGELNFQHYQDCGLSKTKINTILKFRELFEQNPQRILTWHQLGSEELEKEITSLKGLGKW